jgi:lipid-A-disaccharide synthase
VAALLAHCYPADMKCYIVAGEISGDSHASGLMRALIEQRQGIEFTGLGGNQMHGVAPGVEDWVEKAAVVGLSEVLANYSYFKQRMDACVAAIAEQKPDALILVDYPGFNLRLAKAVRELGLPTRIIYYISPQVWAWKKGRLKTMAQVLDLMICIFPFEKPLYEKSGLRTEFGGHPMVDRVKELTTGVARESGLVGWFPGSRYHEVRRHFPLLLRASKIIREQQSGARFVVSAANEKLAAQMREIATAEAMPEAADWVQVGTVYDLMQRCEVGAVASGTATLEAACFGLPYVLIYRVSWPTYVIGKTLVRIPFLGIINVLAGRQVVKELIQQAFSPQSVAAEMISLLRSAEQRQALQADLASVVATLGGGGAYERSAALALKAVVG